VKLVLSMEEALAEPNVDVRMRQRHEDLLDLWPDWVRHYGAEGFRVHLRIADPSQTISPKRPDGFTFLDWGDTPHRQVAETLGFLDYRVEHIARISRWFALKFSLLTDGKANRIESSPPFAQERYAWAHCFRWEISELCRCELLEPGSYGQIPVIPKDCRAVRNGDFTAIVKGRQLLKKRLCPRFYRLCQQIHHANTEAEYDQLQAEIPDAVLLDAVKLGGPIPPGPPVPRPLIIPVINALRSFSRHSREALETLSGYAEIVEGWVRMGYCFWPAAELPCLIGAKVNRSYEPMAFAKRLYRMEFFSLRGDPPQSAYGL
jgi:hypothetical protein